MESSSLGVPGMRTRNRPSADVNSCHGNEGGATITALSRWLDGQIATTKTTNKPIAASPATSPTNKGTQGNEERRRLRRAGLRRGRADGSIGTEVGFALFEDCQSTHASGPDVES